MASKQAYCVCEWMSSLLGFLCTVPKQSVLSNTTVPSRAALDVGGEGVVPTLARITGLHNRHMWLTRGECEHSCSPPGTVLRSNHGTYFFSGRSGWAPLPALWLIYPCAEETTKLSWAFSPVGNKPAHFRRPHLRQKEMHGEQ